ncbi:Transposon Ty3-G Gag-Pol polyprotein [Cucumis melo var. makuwa]|uniref:Transposon Ty3-G Gag-Pol polyprotein n=1 Tax=Cucumis melo var. makuwa TaxID=1194695 RepID=A0A5A7SPP1_CUCMM|nr:Transposon Ty3-G Gag-Pol polyprotein [Cucumis melo var. makuwa]TYK16786.1 Transposon Ty3-G Gag-Pol polyprotein [Cucumis melo var. makuwa]
MYRIILEKGAKDKIQPQRRLNPTLKEVVIKKVLKLKDAGIIYPVPDSTWVSPIHVVPKKTRMTVVKNDKGEMVSMRMQNGWRMCIDYRKLNERKTHNENPDLYKEKDENYGSDEEEQSGKNYGSDEEEEFGLSRKTVRGEEEDGVQRKTMSKRGRG